ncbi:Phospholipase A(1) [Bertholletia excelsa]
MSWGLGWKRTWEAFNLTLNYGSEETPGDQGPTSVASSWSSTSSTESKLQDQELGFRIDLQWRPGDDEDQVALQLQSQLMEALPVPQDAVVVELKAPSVEAEVDRNVALEMKVVKRREPLRAVTLSKVGSGMQSDGIWVLARLLRSELPPSGGVGEGTVAYADHWANITVLNLCACGLLVLPVELTQLPNLEKLYLDNNKLSVLPSELGNLRNLKVLRVDDNMLISVPVELKQCAGLVELSLEQNRLVKPLLDFRSMPQLRILRLYGNPLEFLPEILPLHNLRHLSLANIRIVADENLRSVNVQMEMESSSYFGTTRNKLSAFFSLIFRFSSCHHPLLASALVKIIQDEENHAFVAKDENAIRQLISMISSYNHHVVEQACSALSSLAADVSVAVQLMKADIIKAIELVLKSAGSDELVSVLRVVANLAFVSDIVAQKMLTKDLVKSLKLLCAHDKPEVQKCALLAVGNLAFCSENRHILVTSESMQELLLQLTVASDQCVSKAAARALAIFGENENLRRAIRGRPVSKQGLRILSMDGGGMKGLLTVQILKEIEKRTGARIHEMFDLICGTSTGGMLAVALAIKQMSLDKCEEIYKTLGKLVFADSVPKDNETASWKEKLDQLYKSSSQRFRVVVHGSKHSADEFERLLKEMCADDDGDLLIESAVKNIPKVFVVSTLVSTLPAQPFIFRNYQYPAGTPETSLAVSEGSATSGWGIANTGTQVGYKRNAFIGSCRHYLWQAIRASSAAPYYLDDFSDGVFRWQDGAIVANNPTIFAIREAQLLWPDTKIDTLVSIGCGSVPTKIRKGGWRYLDTGQVLIESACSVDRPEEALSTLLPMLPEIHYFALIQVDERCDMELDETDPTIWLNLEAATEDYIQNNSSAFKSLCERLLHNQHDEKFSRGLKSQQLKAKNSMPNESSPSLGWRRNVLLVEACHSFHSGRICFHARSLETFCSQNGIRLSPMNVMSENLRATPGTLFSNPFASAPVTGSFPSSPPSPLRSDGFQTAETAFSPPRSPPGWKNLSLPAQSLHEDLQNKPRVGIVHLALQNDTSGSILSWQSDVFVVAEPGELADKFVQSVKYNLLSMMRGRKHISAITNISTVAELVACRPYFQIGCIAHRYIGHHTQVMEDDQEIRAYMFRRTVPSVHLTPNDVRTMAGAWRERIIICTGTYGPTPALIKAFIDSGAKAVICPSTEPEEMHLTTFQESDYENRKFELGEEDLDDEEAKPAVQEETGKKIAGLRKLESSRLAPVTMRRSCLSLFVNYTICCFRKAQGLMLP